MIPILYECTETAFMTNGLCRLRDMLTAEVTEERNAGYYLDFTYPVDGANFDQIRPGRIVAVTHDDTGAVEPFDIVSYSRAVDGVVTFHAVHISYRLSGMTAWASNIYSLADGLAVFNNISGQPFTFSADFTSGVYIAAFDGVPRTVRQIMGGIEGSILDACGGEWEYNRFNVTLKKNRGTDRGVMIRYGVNLVDYKEDADYSGTYNAVVPYWTGNDNGNEVIVRGSRVNYGQPTYAGRDIIAPLDLTEKFETKPTAAQLNAMAASVMTAKRPTIPQNSISVDFIRLRDLPEFADVQSLLDCKLCDTVGVTFPLYGMSASFKIVKTVWDPLAERYTAMELGSLATSLSEALGISQGGTFTETSGPVEPADYITEKGKSGNYYYEKWASGKVTAIGYYTFASLTFTSSNNHYRSVSNAFTIPSGIFTVAPQEGRAWIQGSNIVYFSATVGGLTTTGGNCEVWKSTSGNGSNVSVHMELTYTP